MNAPNPITIPIMSPAISKVIIAPPVKELSASYVKSKIYIYLEYAENS